GNESVLFAIPSRVAKETTLSLKTILVFILVSIGARAHAKVSAGELTSYLDRVKQSWNVHRIQLRLTPTTALLLHRAGDHALLLTNKGFRFATRGRPFQPHPDDAPIDLETGLMRFRAPLFSWKPKHVIANDLRIQDLDRTIATEAQDRGATWRY